MLATFFEAALLVGAIYCVGASELDPRVTVLILLAITLLLASITRRQRERAAKAELIRATGTGSQVRASMTAELINSLPSWVTFPDTERADWLNTWIHKLWPYLNVATEDTMKACLNPILERIVKGTPIRRMLFTKFSLGGTPLNVTGVRCHHRGSHAEIVLDMDVSLAGQPDVQLEVGVSSYACVPVVLSQLQLIGTLRVIFSPLCTDWPCFACISIGFVRQPAVDCRLSVANNAFDVMSLPGVSDALLKLITVSLANYFTWPNFVSIPLADNYEADPNIAISMGLKGLLELELVAASGVKRPPSGKEARGGNAVESAMSMLANLQPIKPYLTVSQGGEAVRFRVSKEHSAVAREVLLGVLCEQLIDHPGSDELTVCLWSDQLNDVLLGTCVLPVSLVMRSMHCALDKWLPLTGGAAGMSMHVRAQWRPFPQLETDVEPPPLAASAQETSHDEEVAYDHRISRRALRAGREPRPCVGVLVVKLSSASGLLAMDLGGTSDPYAILRVHGTEQRSKVIHKTREPRWEETFKLLVRDVDSDSLVISLWDHDVIGSHDALGQVSLAVHDLASRPCTQGTYSIAPPDSSKRRRGGSARMVDHGTITLAIYWRQLVNGSELLEQDDQTLSTALVSSPPVPARAAN